MATVSTRLRSPKADAACIQAVDRARRAAVETADGGRVGEHLGHVVEDDRVVTHHFACTSRGYAGWQWAVTVTRASRAKVVTVDECVLIPGPDAVLAPAWVPWHARVEPGDLGPGDLLPTTDDDPRLMAVDTDVDLEPGPGEPSPVVGEIGFGRARVLSPMGRDEAAERWLEGEGGPDTEIARAAPAPCATCGFLVPLGGSLGRVFGVCANGNAPFDGHVVSYDHGCGAHSDVRLDTEPNTLPDHVLDTVSEDVVSSEPEIAADGEPGTA